MAVKEAINILKRRNCTLDDKITTYACLLSNLKSSTICEEELKTQGTGLLKIIYRDILDTDEKIILSALHIFHVYLEFQHIGSFQKSDSELALKSLCQCGHKAPSVDVIKCIFDCLSVQKFQSDVLSKEISVLLDFIEAMNSAVKAQSVSVVEKNVKIFVRLEEQIGKSLEPLASRWARLVFPGLVNLSEEVREMTLSLLEKFRMSLCGAQDLSKHTIKALNAGLVKSLKGLVKIHEVYVLRTWSLIVQVSGKELHKGSTINSLLEIIEICFKGSHVAKHNAFIAWRSLIDNFSLDKAVISDPKRIKLLLMVLKVDIAKVENVAVEKLHTWWHFCSCLGAKLAANFEMVVHPLLQCCAGNSKLQFALDLAQSSRLALKTSAVNSPQSSASVKNLPVFPSVQKLGCEVIAHLVSKVEKSEDLKVTWTLEPLHDEVIGSPAFFVKHAPIIMSTLQKLLISIGNIIEENLILHIWISLGNHLKASMDSSVKAECRDIFSAYLTILHSLVQNQMLQTQTILKMIQICCSFPQKVLASTAYNITGGQTVRSCPAQLLSEVLLNPNVMKDAGAHENFMKLFSTLANAGASNLHGALLFLQTVTEMLDLQASLLASPELLLSMWNTLAHTLQDTINITNEVNQGDALEYNFGCMYAVLLLPVKHQLPSKIPQAVCKVLLKTWKELYHSFARLSALVATAEANSCLEEMCAKLIQNWNLEFQDPVSLEFLSSLCYKMIECADFSAISVSQCSGGGLTLSPSKWVRRRQRPLGNLHSFVHLLATVQTELNLALSKMEDAGITKKQDFPASVILVAHTLVEVYTKLFTHITSANIISNCLAILTSPLARFFQPSTKSGLVKLFVLSFLAKLEKLWQEIAQCITGRYNGQYDSEFLGYLSPLLEVTFLHTRRAIKNQTLTLWNTTFGRMPTLEYPSNLKHILIKMKEKNTIILPGLISSDDAAIVAETPFSEMSLGDSQVPAPALPQLASPKRQKGSLLNRDLSPAGKLSPKPRASPVKVFSPQKAHSLFSGSRKRIDLDLLPKEDFVVIESPVTKKRRLLTEHQLEVLKQKCVLPAMYSNVDCSQDISLMSQFGTETQQSMSSVDVIMINSSQSQEHTNEPVLSTKCLKEYEGNDNATSETLQHHLMASTSLRRSARIQELQSSSTDDIGVPEMQSSLESDTFINETDLNQKAQSQSTGGNADDRMRKLSKKNERSMPKQQNSESLLRSLSSDFCETLTDNPNGLNSSSEHSMIHLGDQKNQDSPFVMFRTAQLGGKVHLSQNSICTESPKGISLRKIRSQDDIPFEKKSEEILLLNCPSPQIKMPRRVPLKKINEQECELEPENPKHRISPGDKISSSSHLNCLVVLSKSDINRTELPVDYAGSVPLSEHVESDSNCNVSCTLVEDTLSPFKMKQHVKCTDHSIAETPLKGENSSSPPLRVTSARKLFVDGDTAIVGKMHQAESVKAVGNIVEIEDNKNEEQLFGNSEITSSQGFEIAADLNILRTEQNMLDSSDCRKGYSEIDKCVSDVGIVSEKPENQLESENLFPNTQISNSSLDMMMPTLSSSLGHLQNFSQMNSLSSSSCESNIASNSSVSELSNKLSSSSESDFICSQPTLADEALTSSRNKRKKGTPKRLLQVKCKRCIRKHRNIKNGYHCCKSLNTSDHNKFVSVSSDITQGKNISRSNQDNCAYTQLSTSAYGDLVPDAPVDVEDSEVAKVKISDRALQEIGEVTPDIKSPRSNPERRHSTVKRMGRPQARKLENSDVSKFSASKKIKIESSDKSDNAGKVEKWSGAGKEEKWSRVIEGRKNKIKSLSPSDKRKLMQPSISVLGSHKNLSKRRSYTKRRLMSDSQHTFPKNRRVKSDQQNDLRENKDMLPMSSYLKKCDTDDCDSLNKDDKSLSDFKSVPVEAVENSQTLDARNSTTSVTVEPLRCTKADLLIIDAALDSALNRILSEALSKTNKKEIISSYNANKSTTGECSSVLSEATDNSTDISPGHLQPGQHSINLSPRSESQEPSSIKNLSELGDSVCNSSADNVEIMETPKNVEMSNSRVLNDCQENVSENSSECNGVEELVGAQIDIVEKCLNSESIQIEKEQKIHDADINEQQTVSKTFSDEFDSDLEEKTEFTGEPIVEKGPQPESEGSSEKSEQVIYDWSPTRSPSCSILKRFTETPLSLKNRRVSFAEPVVSGESPVRKHKEFTSTSPLISAHISSPGQKASIFKNSQGKISKYRRRLESSRKQEPAWSHSTRKIVSPQIQLSYKPTQESQLNNSGPVFPELIDCTNPLDDVLPQLTSSLWHRGLCQLMKGRNINTIGDLCSLTEVQIDQLPIRHPKVESVKSTLNAYMMQHGLAKSFGSNEEMQDDSKTAPAKGSTMEQEVTPASIDNEGIQVHPDADKDLKHLSPIKDPELDPSISSPSHSHVNEIDNNTEAADEDGTAGDDEKASELLLRLEDIQCLVPSLKQTSIVDLFKIFGTLNSLVTNVVDEMKSRQPSFLKK